MLNNLNRTQKIVGTISIFLGMLILLFNINPYVGVASISIGTIDLLIDGDD